MSTLVMFKKYGKCIKPSKGLTTDEFNRFPPIICSDGTFISAQAGETYMCYPKENLDDFEYETVEIHKNDVTEKEELLSLFECSFDKYVYSNVPVVVLDTIIEKHGGLDFNKIEEYINKYN